jgi:hypothetical protein
MPRSPRARCLLAIVWVGAALLAAAVWLVVIGQSRRDQQEVLARAQRDTGNLTHIIAESWAFWHSISGVSARIIRNWRTC